MWPVAVVSNVWTGKEQRTRVLGHSHSWEAWAQPGGGSNFRALKKTKDEAPWGLYRQFASTASGSMSCRTLLFFKFGCCVMHPIYHSFSFVRSARMWKQRLTCASVSTLGSQTWALDVPHICTVRAPFPSPDYLATGLLGTRTTSASCLCLFIN